jgi:peptide/nickel transport system permease protein
LKQWLQRQRWWIQRVATLPVHVFVFSLLVFVVIRLIPGNPAISTTGGFATSAQIVEIDNELGVTGSLFHQLTTYLHNVVTLHLGVALSSGVPVANSVGDLLPQTAELALMALTGALVFAAFGSFMIVTRPNNWISRAFRVYGDNAGAIPEFCIGIVGIFFFYAKFHWTPPPDGRISIGLTEPAPITHFPFLDSILRGDFTVTANMAEHLILPLAVMTLGHSPILVKVLTTSLGQALDAPATKFRTSIGCSRPMVVLSMFRRAAPPVVTLIGTLFGGLLGGAIIIEQLFSFGGIGQFIVSSAQNDDIVAIQGFLLIMAAVALVIFLLVDLINMYVDPRRRPGVAVAP